MNKQQNRFHREPANRRWRLAHLPEPPLPKAAVLVALLLPCAALLAACGSSPSTASVANDSASTASAHASRGGATQARGLVAYASCMRSHGVVHFPDPDGSGEIPKSLVIPAARDVSIARWRAAGDACSHLLPAGGLSGHDNPTITARDERDYLRAAACMRSHGFSNFPDPTFSNGTVNLAIPSSIDTHSAAFTRAAQTCRRLIPRGLPYNQ